MLIITTVDSRESWEGAWRWSKSEDLPKCYCFSEVLGNRTGRRFTDDVQAFLQVGGIVPSFDESPLLLILVFCDFLLPKLLIIKRLMT